MVLNRIIPQPCFVIKRELLFFPIVGFYALKFRQIIMDRRNPRSLLTKFLAQVEKRLAEGRPLIIFPEGTRAAHGEAPPLKPGIWMLYDRLNYPVIPVTLDSGKFWARRAVIKKPGCVNVTFHPPLPSGLTKEKFLETLHTQINSANSI